MLDKPMVRRQFIAGAAASGVLAAAAARAAELDAPCGPMRGITSEGVTAFLGLPYAAPPIGPLRYASPRPAPRWTEPRDCSRAGAAAIQTFGGGAAWLYEPITFQGEDCLFLNVWTPDPRGRRPVMVWLHGGAWRAGRGDAAGMVGTQLARAGDVVVVTVNGVVQSGRFMGYIESGLRCANQGTPRFTCNPDLNHAQNRMQR